MPSSSWRCRPILAACADAGIDPREVDGFASYGNDRSRGGAAGRRAGHASELRFSNMQWGGGGGGVCGVGGQCRGGGALRHGRIASSPSARWRRGSSRRYGRGVGGHGRRAATMPSWRPTALMSPAQRFAMKITPLHARARHPARGAARHRAGLLPPRADQPARGDARQAAGRGEVRRLALDRRALPPLFDCCHGERRRRARCCWCRPSARRTCRTSRPTCWARRRAAHHRSAAPVHNAPHYACAALRRRWRSNCTRWPAWARRTWTSCRPTRTSPAAC